MGYQPTNPKPPMSKIRPEADVPRIKIYDGYGREICRTEKVSLVRRGDVVVSSDSSLGDIGLFVGAFVTGWSVTLLVYLL